MYSCPIRGRLASPSPKIWGITETVEGFVGGEPVLRGYGLILLAAFLWSTLGLFYNRLLHHHDLTTTTIAFFRAAVASLTLFVGLSGRAGRWPAISRREVPFYALFGAFGVAAFFLVYIRAIDRVGMGVAAVLLYTAPAWVALIAALFLGEPLTRRKGVALLLAFGGAALVARIYHLGSVRLDLVGILFGLGSGLTYGLYTIFSKVGVRQRSSWEVLAYALGFGALFMLPWQSAESLRRAVTTPGTLLWLLGLGWLPTLGAGVAFNQGLKTVPAGGASIVANLEPALAALWGALFLHERLEPFQVLGGAMILGAVLILQREG
ncbi:MAG TPA: EamA/RhaT family transporter [Chloroflexi bacterium]|nr:EamA/RhaT family transporter [Chloroflexota bacterium]